MLKFKKSKFAVVISVLVCCCMVFGSTAMAEGSGSAAPSGKECTFEIPVITVGEDATREEVLQAIALNEDSVPLSLDISSRGLSVVRASVIRSGTSTYCQLWIRSFLIRKFIWTTGKVAEEAMLERAAAYTLGNAIYQRMSQR